LPTGATLQHGLRGKTPLDVIVAFGSGLRLVIRRELRS